MNSDETAQAAPLVVNIVNVDLPPQRPPHVHRFAWAMMTDGRTVPICYGCGARG